MNPQQVFCPNMACPARGQIGQGNVIGHGQRRRRYRCTVCRKTFSPRTGTMFHRRHTGMQLMVQIVTLVSYGCPVVAIQAAFGIQARTVRDWVAAAGRQSAAVQQALVQQPQELGQVQADELRVGNRCLRISCHLEVHAALTFPHKHQTGDCSIMAV